MQSPSPYYCIITGSRDFGYVDAGYIGDLQGLPRAYVGFIGRRRLDNGELKWNRVGELNPFRNSILFGDIIVPVGRIVQVMLSPQHGHSIL